MNFLDLFMVMSGAAIGGGARYVAEAIWPYNPLANELPVMVLIINVVGSMLAGLHLGLTGGPNPLGQVEATNFFFVTGVLGGFTTFSAFSLQTIEMLFDGEPVLALLNISISVVGGLAAAAFGYGLGQSGAAV